MSERTEVARELRGGLRRAIGRIRTSPSGSIAAVTLLALVVLAVVGPLIWGTEASEINLADARQGPSIDHPLGTDDLGRDVLARTLAATRLSMFLALGATAIGAVGGILLGGSVGVIHGRAKRFVSRVIDFSVAFPPLLLALLVVSMFGAGALPAVVAVGISLIPRIARPAQTLAITIATSDYVAAARLNGAGRGKVLRRHLLPNMSDALFIIVAAEVGTAIVTVSALSFLGFGVQPPAYDWGRMLGEGLQSIYATPLPALVPGAAIFIVALASNSLGDALARSSTSVPAPAREPRRRGSSTVAVRGGEPVAEASAAGPGPGDGAVPNASPIVEVRDLSVRFPGPDGSVSVLSRVSMEIQAGEIVGVVGESGSGKTMLSLAIAGLVPYPGQISAQRLIFQGNDVRTAGPRQQRRLFGGRLAMIFQDPGTSMNPSLKVGRQVGEVLEVNQGASRTVARDAAIDAMRVLGIAAPARRARQFPHELSGGMRQRAMAAGGLITEPALLIADEPTTALDVTVQAQLLETLRAVNQRLGTAILFVSHDIAVVAELCERVVVMYRGRVVETLPAADLLAGARHPYTRSLVEAAVEISVGGGAARRTSSEGAATTQRAATQGGDE